MYCVFALLAALFSYFFALVSAAPINATQLYDYESATEHTHGPRITVGRVPLGDHCSHLFGYFYCRHSAWDSDFAASAYDAGHIIADEPDHTGAISADNDGDLQPVPDINDYRCYTERFWHLDNIRPPQFCVPQSAGRNRVIYIVDTYVEVEHSDFGGRAKRGYSAVNGKHQHGTHVAGLAAGGVYGVCKTCTVVAVEVLNADGTAPYSQIIAGLSWIGEQQRSGVVNLSLSGPRSAILNHALKLLYYRHRDTVVVAAGNTGRDACQESPASCDVAIVVGAYDERQRAADWSAHGKCLTVYAPGVNMLSLVPGNRIAYMSGTSMAAPVVAGVVGLNGANRWRVAASAETGGVTNLRSVGSPNLAVRLTFFSTISTPVDDVFVVQNDDNNI